uniref:EMI domain-containing protein n=1 Tax=Accipiter nisus TaxID=211598 RepID=A0A8B9NCJ4_9AVES
MGGLGGQGGDGGEASQDPTSPHVLSFGSFTAAVKESYTKPHVVSSAEPCPGVLGSPLPCLQQRWEQPPPHLGDCRVSPWLWGGGGGWSGAVPLRGVPMATGGLERSCSHPNGAGVGRRIVYRTEYRQAVRTDYRRRYQCCLGYYESRDTCVPRCTQECVHGRCVAPDLCQCEPGWRGSNCSSECDEQSWGPGCGHRCNCHHGAPCDPLSGVCSCPPGFADPLCHQPCPPGTYGQGCRLSCPCHHRAPCNASTGACLCPPGLAGPL